MFCLPESYWSKGRELYVLKNIMDILKNPKFEVDRNYNIPIIGKKIN